MQRIVKPCANRFRGCSETIEHGKFCEKCRGGGLARTEQASAAARGYGRSWQAYRLNFLREHPFCTDPFRLHAETSEQFIPAVCVDHIKAHRGDKELFWDPSNHQPLCKRCHDYKTAKFDGGFGRERASC